MKWKFVRICVCVDNCHCVNVISTIKLIKNPKWKLCDTNPYIHRERERKRESTEIYNDFFFYSFAVLFWINCGIEFYWPHFGLFMCVFVVKWDNIIKKRYKKVNGVNATVDALYTSHMLKRLYMKMCMPCECVCMIGVCVWHMQNCQFGMRMKLFVRKKPIKYSTLLTRQHKLLPVRSATPIEINQTGLLRVPIKAFRTEFFFTFFYCEKVEKPRETREQCFPIYLIKYLAVQNVGNVK